MKRVFAIIAVLLFLTSIVGCAENTSSTYFKEDEEFVGYRTPIEECEELVGLRTPIEEYEIVTDESGSQYVFGRINVFFIENTSDQRIDEIFQMVDAEVLGHITDTMIYQIGIKDDNKVEDLISTLMQYEDVSSASRDYLVEDLTDPPSDPWQSPVYTEDVVWDESNPEGSNWGIEAIYGLSAWGYKDMMSTVKVGVIDTGFDIAHEDLCIHNENVFPNMNNKNASHGTKVCGVIGAVADNGIGIAGVAPNSEICVVKTQDYFDIYWCIKWLVVIKKTKVINISQGFSASDIRKHEGDEVWLKSVRTEMSSFIKGLLDHSDFLIVCAAGNREMDTLWQTPFSSVEDQELKKHLLVVSSIGNEKSGLTPCRAYGNSIDLLAPGEDILCTIPKEFSISTAYGFDSGTSLSSPHVAGVAAMVLGFNPDLTASEVRDIILNSSDKTLSYHGRDIKIVNAKLAVESVINQEHSEDNSLTDFQEIEDGTYMMIIKNSGDYETSPAESGYVVPVDGGYMITCDIIEEAEITYDEYNRLVAGEIVTKTFGVETWEIRWEDADDYEIWLEVIMDGEHQSAKLFSVPTPTKPELLCPEHGGEAWMYWTGEETELFISNNTVVSTNYDVEKSFDDYLITGGTEDYSGFFADYYYADVVDGKIVRLGTWYGP